MIVPTLLFAALCGAVAAMLGFPVPWMIGPLLGIAVAKVVNARVTLAPHGLECGQLIIGAAIGMSFTPDILIATAQFGVQMALAGLAAIGIGAISGLAVARWARVDAASGFFACVPGGASEMMMLGERYGAAADFVAMSQSLRMMLVVVTIPPAFTLFGVNGAELFASRMVPASLLGILLLLALCVIAGLALSRLRAPTPWLLGPLFVSIFLTGTDRQLTSMPVAVLDCGQMLIGIAIGCRMKREFFLRMPRLMLVAVAATGLTIFLSAILGVSLAIAFGIAVPSALLAVAPGGIAEMSVTAKALNLGVPLVTAFHMTRLVLILLLTQSLYRLVVRLMRPDPARL